MFTIKPGHYQQIWRIVTQMNFELNELDFDGMFTLL